MEPRRAGFRWPGSVVASRTMVLPAQVASLQLAGTTASAQLAQAALRGGSATAVARPLGEAGAECGGSLLCFSSAWPTQRLGTAVLEGRGVSRAARLRLVMTHRATRGSAALPWRRHTMVKPVIPSSTRLGVRGPSRESFKRHITTSLIVPSLPGSLALSRMLAWLLVLMVEVRSAVAVAAALLGSFSVMFVLTLICIRPSSMATAMASPTSLNADFLVIHLGPEDQPSESGTRPRASPHPTAQSLRRRPKVGTLRLLIMGLMTGDPTTVYGELAWASRASM